jgi:hypothetical protein
MRLVVALMVGTMVFAAVYAAAASVSLTSESLAAGDAVVGRCDGTQFTTEGFIKLADDDTITHVKIGGIDEACVGGMLTVTLVDESVQPVGAATVLLTASDAPEITIAIPGSPSHSEVKNVAIIVIGPTP